MSLSVAALRAYDTLKRRPGARLRRSDARDTATLEAIGTRLRELINACKIGEHVEPTGAAYVFWSEIEIEIGKGSFDDLVHYL